MGKPDEKYKKQPTNEPVESNTAEPFESNTTDVTQGNEPFGHGATVNQQSVNPDDIAFSVETTPKSTPKKDTPNNRTPALFSALPSPTTGHVPPSPGDAMDANKARTDELVVGRPLTFDGK